MPIHDWTKVPAGLFHHFHHRWCSDIAVALNGGTLPKGLTALVEQRTGAPIPDVLAVEDFGGGYRPDETSSSGGAVTLQRPRARQMFRSDRQIYAEKASRIAVKHHLGRTVAILEILSPGNKDSRSSTKDFIDKTSRFILAGIHVLMVDLFPPGKRDPLGMHKLIWGEVGCDDDPFEFPLEQDRLAASYEADSERSAFVETFGVGETLPEMPLFLPGGWHVKVPLERTYLSTWETCPETLKNAVVTGVLPRDDDD